jgi:RNA 2',3'-cyclic 3'-phosphodiesterase
VRVFIGLQIPMKSIPAYIALENNIRDSLAASGIEAYFKTAEQFHLTLEFLGEIRREQIDKIEIPSQAINEFAGTELSIETLGGFPSEQQAKKLWLGIRKEPRLENLRIKIREMLSLQGLAREQADFFPHITVANLDRAQDISRVLQGLQPMGPLFSIPAEIVSIYQSEPGPMGSTYKILSSLKS